MAILEINRQHKFNWASEEERNKTARHNWWPVSYSIDLKDDKPLSVMLFGEPLVVYRRSDGALTCLQDLCPHKGAPLSSGYVQNDEIVCRFHGWRFDAQGNCQHPQELGKSQKIKRVSYAALDDGLLIWVYPVEGVDPVAFHNPLDHFTKVSGCKFDYHRSRAFSFNQPWQLWAYSFVDGTHHEFAHSGTFLPEQREQLKFEFDAAVSPAAFLVRGVHDRMLGLAAYLSFCPTSETSNKQFLTLLPISMVLPARLTYALFNLVKGSERIYDVVYEDFYLIDQQYQRIKQGASLRGITGAKYGYPTSDSFVAWDTAHDGESIWFKGYEKTGSMVHGPRGDDHVRAPAYFDTKLELGQFPPALTGASDGKIPPPTWYRQTPYVRMMQKVFSVFSPVR